ncbi:MAG TPA: helix-turn-helix domain-containing protein [Candidatus Hydrogenedentes bacterium]|nr:helix-turn-helix domain-containing protein [Candidatus Hydrogenedentota bacterium]
MKNEGKSIDSGLINERQAAKYLGMSRSYLAIARMTGAGRRRKSGPPFYKISRAVRYSIRDLDAWLAKHRVAPSE